MPPKKITIDKSDPVSTMQKSTSASNTVVSSIIDEKNPINQIIVDKNSIDKKSRPKKPNLQPNLQSNEKQDEVLVDTSKITQFTTANTTNTIHTTTIKTKKSVNKTEDQKLNFDDDDNIDYRTIMLNYDFTKNKTRPIITKYEKALLIGKRAKQIESGAFANVKVMAGQNAIQIAEEELRQRKIPLLIKRPLGNKFEYWKPVDMEVDMD